MTILSTGSSKMIETTRFVNLFKNVCLLHIWLWYPLAELLKFFYKSLNFKKHQFHFKTKTNPLMTHKKMTILLFSGFFVMLENSL